ncbi:hypothetical protein [Desulfovibrio sp. JC010]|uniref:hypothetical protein n=1 Tax=Desulfovibrio sp. JC010 TaxID=2593641 RepID=UPI0013D69747|nr:hypothetical protein [Desulfovibrio sp. JC010]NDV28576.1 hypothetical protein [Desulfovibrio sp. JC010]
MVLIYSEVLEKIDKTHWFKNLGQQNDFYTSAVSLEQAVGLWRSAEFEEAHSVAWEAFKSNIPRDRKGEWARCFSECKDSLLKSLGKAPGVHELLSQCQQDIDDFILLLPHIGAIGESLTENADFNFFTNQLEVYDAGHWVCGWLGDLYEDEFVYPKSNFIVF